MSIDLTPCFETAAHAGDIFKTVLEKVGCGAETAVTVIAVNHDRLLFIRILNELLHIAVVQMQRSRNVRRLVRARIADIDEHGLIPIEPLFSFVNLYLWNLHISSSLTLSFYQGPPALSTALEFFPFHITRATQLL